MNTAESHNAGLIGSIELEPVQYFYGPALSAMPTNPPAIDPRDVLAVLSSHSEQTATNETQPEGQGISKRNLRLKIAREAWRELEKTTDPDRRLALMQLVERMTAGRKLQKKREKKPSAFD
jgi:hypothetical protein